MDRVTSGKRCDFDAAKGEKGLLSKVKMELDVTKLPIPKTWPMDGGRYITLPLVVTKDPKSGEHNLGMYRGQVFGPKEAGLIGKFTNMALTMQPLGQMEKCLCHMYRRTSRTNFLAIAPLPDNLEVHVCRILVKDA